MPLTDQTLHLLKTLVCMDNVNNQNLCHASLLTMPSFSNISLTLSARCYCEVGYKYERCCIAPFCSTSIFPAKGVAQPQAHITIILHKRLTDRINSPHWNRRIVSITSSPSCTFTAVLLIEYTAPAQFNFTRYTRILQRCTN